MADEAVLNIRLQDDSKGGGQGQGGNAADIPRAEEAKPPPAGKDPGVLQRMGKTFFGKKGGQVGEMLGNMAGEGAGAEGAEGAAAGGGAALGGIIAGAAVLGAVVLLGLAAKKTAEAVIDFGKAFINPDTDPSNSVVAIGQFTSAVSKTVPIVGLFGQALGGTIETIGEFMKSLDGFVDRYAEFSPQLAMAQAQAEITQTLNDFRRAQEVTPALLEYIQARTELQQKFEDAKAEFITKITPAILMGMHIAEELLPVVTSLLDTVIEIGSYLPWGIGDRITEIARDIKKSTEQMGDEQFELPTEAIMRGKFPFETRGEGPRFNPWS